MRTPFLTFRTLGLLSACLVILATLPGCGNSGSDNRLELLGFNLDRVNGAFVNERLIFTFSAPVDPASVNIQTLQIRYDASKIDVDGDCFPDDPANVNAVPEGDFLFQGNQVIFQPHIPTLPTNNDVGFYPTHKIDPTPDPQNCQRTEDLIMTYTVFIPGLSATYPSVLRTKRDGKPMQKSFNSFFIMVRDDTFPPDIAMSSFLDFLAGAPLFDRLDGPTEGETGVDPNTAVRIRFTEPILPSSVTSEAVYLTAFGPSNGREEIVPSEISFDQIESTIILTPTIVLPSDVEVVAHFTEDLLDFGGHALQIPEGFVFPSFRTAPSGVTGSASFFEGFDTNDNEDTTETSALWNDPGAPGGLLAGYGGGTAFRGSLVLDPASPETYTFDTGPGIPGAPLPSFDYSDILIGPNATVKAIGKNPLVFKSTTNIVVKGTLDLRGLDADDVLSGAVLGTEGAAGECAAGSGGDGGNFVGDSGANGTGPGGGGGSIGYICEAQAEAGGGGGGEYSGGATAGLPDDGGGVGGAPGLPYGSEDLNPFALRLVGGSGGGGAGATCYGGQAYPGAGGGAGGGALWLHAAQTVEVTNGSIVCDGGKGGDNFFASGTQGGAAGGGGSGGAILIQGVELAKTNANAVLSANRGGGGVASDGGANNGSGGLGGRGRIRIESAVLSLLGTFVPAPSFTVYLIDGQTSVGTSEWFDSGALFPDYSFQKGDNAGIFPPDVRGQVLRYYFQGAGPDPADPSQPDVANARPAPDDFTDNIDEIDDCQFIRVKIVFTYTYPYSGTPAVDFFRILFDYKGGTPKN